jgi:hypothetical protein
VADKHHATEYTQGNNGSATFSMSSALQPLLCKVAVNTPYNNIGCFLCVIVAEAITRQLETEQIAVYVSV